MVELPFLKKKEQPVIVGKGFPPVDKVRDMSSRGFTEPEIIDTLRREGFSADEIDRALTQVLRLGVSGPSQQIEQPAPAPEPKKDESQEKIPTLQEIFSQKQSQAPVEIPETSLPESYYQESYSAEEYIDYLIQLKSEEIEQKIEQIEEMHNELSKRVRDISQKISQISSLGGTEQKGIREKIEELNKNYNDINARLGGLEKIIKETLPIITESIHSLNDVVQHIKKES